MNNLSSKNKNMLAFHARREIKKVMTQEFVFKIWALDSDSLGHISLVTRKAEVFIFRVLDNEVLGRIFRESVNANPFFVYNNIINRLYFVYFEITDVKKGQKVKTEHLSEKLQKINQNSL